MAGDSMSFTPPPANPVLAGQVVTFTADISPTNPGPVPTGWVTFFVNGVNKGQFPVTASGTDGVASYTMTFNVIGSYKVVAVYTGDPTYQAKTMSMTENVTKAPTSTTVATSGSPSVYLAPVTFGNVTRAAARRQARSVSTTTAAHGDDRAFGRCRHLHD